MAKEISIDDKDINIIDDSILDKDLYKKEDIDETLSQFSWFVNPFEDSEETE